MTEKTLTITIRLPDPRALRGLAPLFTLPTRTLARLAVWHRRAADRRTLAEMTEAQRKDIGLDWETLRAEIAKPFWRP